MKRSNRHKQLILSETWLTKYSGRIVFTKYQKSVDHELVRRDDEPGSSTGPCLIELEKVYLGCNQVHPNWLQVCLRNIFQAKHSKTVLTYLHLLS